MSLIGSFMAYLVGGTVYGWFEAWNKKVVYTLLILAGVCVIGGYILTDSSVGAGNYDLIEILVELAGLIIGAHTGSTMYKEAFEAKN